MELTYFTNLFLWRNSPTPAQAVSLSMFLDHTQWHTHTVWIPWTTNESVAEVATYAKHNKHKRRISVPSAGLKPAIPAIVASDLRIRVKTHIQSALFPRIKLQAAGRSAVRVFLPLDRTATGTGFHNCSSLVIKVILKLANVYHHATCNFQASIALYLSSWLFWVVTQRMMVVVQRSAWPSKMRPIGCPETSVRNYQYTIRNNSEERRPQHSIFHSFLTWLGS
jgi:hypothetical protein